MKIFSSSKRRFFLVGCPRSGTTLLQSLLTAHPQVASFPESHFFRYLIPKHNTKRYKLGIASLEARIRFQEFLKEIDREDMLSYLSRFAIFQYQHIQAFLNVLDTTTQQQEKSIWIEKTPGHVRYVDYIEKYIKEVKFIHIIRNGTDVISSLYEVSRKYPQTWHEPWSIDKCINQWKQDVQISLSCQDKLNHVLVQYEQLVHNPALVLDKICDFINISFDEAMLENYTIATKKIVLENEPWKISVGEAIDNKNGQKFNKLFSSEQKSYILKHLEVVQKQIKSL
ncbi:sulfotransferase [Myxosarcina sp. GI1]|uniref:sulfotransferase family protein n=1 Tax=Myxosarcina sp. GI1 TaxID=1541065 RepID=UPI000563E831|nr:sulfotransferase [Myxosarcina sp. GI1]